MIIPPSNIILSNQYTSGGEFVYAESNLPYQGYYYELNSKYFIGKTFNTSSPELLKISSDKISVLKSNPSSSIYNNISNQEIPKEDLTSISYLEGEGGIRYIAKKINTGKLFFISKEDYLNNRNNPLYILISITFDIEFGFIPSLENIQAIPEIEVFINEFSNNDEDRQIED